MKTVRRLLYRDIAGSVFFVTLAFLSLFFFIDFVDELDEAGRRGRTLGLVLLSVSLRLPGHLYELLPISVLIGTIYALARMAQSSEFTILRTGGLGPGRALSLLAVLGMVFAAVTFVVGDFVMPPSERSAALVYAAPGSGVALGRTGAWLKERRSTPEGERSYSINIAAAGGGGRLSGVRIFEFDADSRLLRRIEARQGRVDAAGLWKLSDVEVTTWPSGAPTSEARPVSLARMAALAWASGLDVGVVSAAVLPLSTMSTLDLYRYSTHLSHQEQASQRYEIQFWKKALYPLACVVMVGLALPFAYLHARSGGISLKVFGGILLGISFVLLNNVAGHLGMLRNWTPVVAAAAPSVVYLLLSLAAFAWLVRYR
jgi:lipopolysaccharide export system permease protein